MTAEDDGAQDPADLTERVVTIWRELIPVPGITADTNLFDLGATSMVAIRMKGLICTRLGREIEVEDVLDHPTPRELAEVIATARPWLGDET